LDGGVSPNLWPVSGVLKHFWTVLNVEHVLFDSTYDWFKAIYRLGSSTISFILHFTSFLTFSSLFLGVFVVSWSLLIVHITFAIVL